MKAIYNFFKNDVFDIGGAGQLGALYRAIILLVVLTVGNLVFAEDVFLQKDGDKLTPIANKTEVAKILFADKNQHILRCNEVELTDKLTLRKK